jgi:hypothetical protein
MGHYDSAYEQMMDHRHVVEFLRAFYGGVPDGHRTERLADAIIAEQDFSRDPVALGELRRRLLDRCPELDPARPWDSQEEMRQRDSWEID